MFKKLVALLLVVGWVTLSCFDVVEDLDQIRTAATISNAPSEESASSKGWGPLTNNIVESANKVPGRKYVELSNETRESDFDIGTLPIFLGPHQLHKLNRVFLI